jgi:hypothetical protein
VADDEEDAAKRVESRTDGSFDKGRSREGKERLEAAHPGRGIATLHPR